MTDRISIPALRAPMERLRELARPGHRPHVTLDLDDAFALVEAVEAARRVERTDAAGKLIAVIGDASQALEALEDALARFDFGDEEPA